MEEKLEWLIRYADGSEFTNLDGEPHEAPRYGVQFVYQADEDVGVRTETSPIGHWVFREGEWLGFEDHMGFWDHMFHSGQPVIPIFGRTLLDSKWQQMVGEEAEWRFKQPKSAWRPRERRP